MACRCPLPENRGDGGGKELQRNSLMLLSRRLNSQQKHQSHRGRNGVAPIGKDTLRPLQLIGDAGALRFHRLSEQQITQGVLVPAEHASLRGQLRRHTLKGVQHCHTATPQHGGTEVGIRGCRGS